MKHFTKKELHRQPGTVPSAMELRIRRLGWAGRVGEQDQKDDPSHQQVLAAISGQTRVDKFPLHDERRETDNLRHPWAKQFRDDINSLKEFDEGDDFVSQRNGDWMMVFF